MKFDGPFDIHHHNTLLISWYQIHFIIRSKANARFDRKDVINATIPETSAGETRVGFSFSNTVYLCKGINKVL